MIQLSALCIDANDPPGLAGFWAGVLGRETTDAGRTLLPDDGVGFPIRFTATPERKAGQNRMHLDLTSSQPGDQERTVARALQLGARHLDVGQGPDAGHVVLADPEGNEFCVLPAGNAFLAGCGLVGALNCDGSQAVGYFWSTALGWPLVWDQDEETAIQSPRGGPKITWSGPPLMPRDGKDRWHVELALAAGDDEHAEIERLESLGAARAGRDHADAVAMVDPDGNEFRVLGPPGTGIASGSAPDAEPTA